MQLDIIMPVYNEGEIIEETLKQIKEKVKIPYNLFIIYDFDEDNTLPKVNKLKKELPVTLVKNNYGQGVLNAIKTAFEKSRADYKVVVMADLSDKLEIIDEMYKKAKTENYDIICGSRYMKGGKQIGGPKFKGFLSKMAGKSLHFLTRIPTHDITNAFKMYRKEVLREITIKSRGGFEYSTEITIKAYNKGFRITEIPTVWMARTSGVSRFRLRKWLPKYLYWYFYAVFTTWSRKITPLFPVSKTDKYKKQGWGKT